ncbi:MAG: dynamin family protein [Bryobacteraceae bacterium]|nr:dynamin family protein [Bryobacteraceae bacterium]
MLGKLLPQKHEQSFITLRSLLSDLRAALAQLGAPEDDQQAIRAALLHLDSIFLLVVAGEFNAGKSAFINALIGQQVLEQGPTPTTTRIQVVKHGPSIERTSLDALTDLITAPASLLRDIHIVDTPGTNAIERHHEAITQDFLPRADIVFFLTSADRPLTESERAFLAQIREWGKKIVIVLNKIDILECDADLDRVRAFISEGVHRLLGFTPEIFPLAARPALQAKISGDAAALARSRFEDLERYISATLDEQERLRLKILNPLGVALRTIEKHLSEIEARATLLKGDWETIERIQRELEIYKSDMNSGFRLRLADVDNVLHEFERRGNDFFDETIRFSRVFELMDKRKIKADFERKVVADTPAQIEQKVAAIIDWLVSSDLQQWQSVRDHLTRRRSEQTDRVAGAMSSGFDYDRGRLLDTVGKSAQRTLADFDKDAEAQRMAASLQSAVAGMALMGAGAVGLGAAVSFLATTAAADVTGILAASTMAAVGLLIIPRRRHMARKELRDKIAQLKQQLMSALTGQFDKEVERSSRKVNDAVAPYSRFVRAEKEKLEKVDQELKQIRDRMLALRAETSTTH